MHRSNRKSAWVLCGDKDSGAGDGSYSGTMMGKRGKGFFSVQEAGTKENYSVEKVEHQRKLLFQKVISSSI